MIVPIIIIVLGRRIQAQADEMRDELYQLDWERQNKSFQKGYNIVQAVMTAPIRLGNFQDKSMLGNLLMVRFGLNISRIN